MKLQGFIQVTVVGVAAFVVGMIFEYISRLLKLKNAAEWELFVMTATWIVAGLCIFCISKLIERMGEKK